MLDRNTYFITDLHADPTAFEHSIDLCDDYGALHIIGGDCLDKGPSNLKLLLKIKSLSNEVDVKILAGNHDLRMLMVLLNWDRKDSPEYEKLFTPTRFEKRITPFLNECGGIEAAKKMFLDPSGEFYWFYDSMSLMHRDNEVLFVHAGLGDSIVSDLRRQGIDYLNERFSKSLKDRDKLSEMYYGPMGTCFRTKYRTSDDCFTIFAAKNLFNMGIGCVAHGHDSQIIGHDLELRHGILHLKCDCTLDRNTRREIGLRGEGFGIAIFNDENSFVECYSSESAMAFDLDEYLTSDFCGHL